MIPACSAISDYIAIVRNGNCCKDQILLCDYIERVFETEALTINQKQLEAYFVFERYFPFKLLPWEKFCFALHNCVYRTDGQLRWPTLLILVGRGAGKNGYLAFEDFCLLTPTNGVKNYDIDIFATSEDQARTTFDDVYGVLEDNAKLSKYFDWNKEVITNKRTGSRLRFRTSGFKTKDGGRPGKVDFDEYHAYQNWKMVDVATTGLGKKAFPRKTIITTDGDVREGPLDLLKTQAESILKGKIEDNGLLPFICRLDNPEEVDRPEKWGKANPSLYAFPTLQRELEAEYADYKINPAGNSSFMVKRMNCPQGDTATEVTSWENLLAASRELPDLTGCQCIAGIDYAKTQDFVVAGLLFKMNGVYYWISHTWVCKQSGDLPRIKAPLEQWKLAGLLTFVAGPEIPPETPAAWLAEQAQKYNIQTLGMDLYRYTLLARALREEGFDTDRDGMNNIKLTRKSGQMLYAPTIASLFATQKIVWGDSPIMRWYTNNTCVVTGRDGNMVYEKIEGKSRKTDGFMAFVAAMCASENLEDSADAGSYEFNVITG